MFLFFFVVVVCLIFFSYCSHDQKVVTLSIDTSPRPATDISNFFDAYETCSAISSISVGSELTSKAAHKPKHVTIQMEAIEQYFYSVIFTMPKGIN